MSLPTHNTTCLRRETTEDVGKMFTTLYEEELEQSQYHNNQLQQTLAWSSANTSFDALSNSQNTQDFINALMSPPASPWDETASGPASPCSSTFTPLSSPATLKMESPNTDEELVDLFNITIEDLLAGSPFSFQADQVLLPSDPLNSQHFALFSNDQPMLFDLDHHQQPQQNQHTTKQESFSPLPSPTLSCAPHPYCHAVHASQPLNRGRKIYPSRKTRLHQQPSSPRRQHHHSERCSHSPELSDADSVTSIYSPASSPSPCSPSSSSAATSPSPVIPSTSTMQVDQDGMTVIRNEDGSIMVFNPATEGMTFRCEICPGESFGRIHDLKRHQASKHQEMTWPCDFCHRPFVRRDALLRHYTVKSAREDGIHPAAHEVESLMAARARAKLIR